MAYTDQSTPPAPGSDPAPRGMKPAAQAPSAPAEPEPKITATNVKDYLEREHGPEACRHAAYYANNLQYALKMMHTLAEIAGEARGQVDWETYREEIRSASASLLNAADAVKGLAQIKDLEGYPNCKMLNPGLLACVPKGALARIISAGLECESEDLLDLIETVPGPEVEPWQVCVHPSRISYTQCRDQPVQTLTFPKQPDANPAL